MTPIKPAERFSDLVERHLLASPIEEEFYRVISKYLDPKAELKNQYPIGHYRLDFLVSVGGLKIGFECDGKNYHDKEHDEARDSAILRHENIDSIIRLRGTDIVYRLSDALLVIACWYPQLFSGRGINNILQLSSRSMEEAELNSDYVYFSYPNDPEDEDSGLGLLYVTRRRNAR